MAEKKEENTGNTFGFFDNKYVRGGIAAVIAAYAAKQDPYLLKGFSEKIDELEAADRARRDKFIESATTAATQEIARNKLRRLERRNAASPDIKQAVALGMNPYFAGQAYQTGNLKTFLKQKALKPDLALNELYQVSKEYRGKIPGFTTDDVLEAIAGPTAKLTGLLDNIEAPKRTSFLSNFIKGTDEDTTVKSEIDKRIQAQQVSEDTDTKDVDFSQISLTPKGKTFLEAAGKKQIVTSTTAKSDLAKWVVGKMGLVGVGGKSAISISGDEFIFQSDSAANNDIAKNITDKMLNEVEFLVGNVNSPAYNDRVKAVEIVKNKYQKAKEGGGFELNIDQVNFNEETPIMPKGWTPGTPTKEQVEKKEKKRDASKTIQNYKDIVQSIKDDRGLTTTERNRALTLQKKIYQNIIKGLMRETPPKATQADLDQII